MTWRQVRSSTATPFRTRTARSPARSSPTAAAGTLGSRQTVPMKAMPMIQARTGAPSLSFMWTTAMHFIPTPMWTPDTPAFQAGRCLLWTAAVSPIPAYTDIRSLRKRRSVSWMSGRCRKRRRSRTLSSRPTHKLSAFQTTKSQPISCPLPRPQKASP